MYAVQIQKDLTLEKDKRDLEHIDKEIA